MSRVRSGAVAVAAAASIATGALAVGRATPSGGGGCIAGPIPSHACTPGLLNPTIHQSNIKTTICKGGWTATVRPTQTVTNHLKAEAAERYGISPFDPTKYEGDHLISLELGGAPASIKNLWDEPHTAVGPDGKDAGSFVKDAFENYLNFRVCRAKARLTLRQAQHMIRGDWYAAYVAAGRPKDPYNHHHGG